MKVLVIGQGGREHSIVYHLAHSPSVNEVHACPGNDGMRPLALCHDWDWRDTDRLVEHCLRIEIELIIIGPEDPLVAGLADKLRDRGLLVVGPGAEGAKLEASKIFAKEFMQVAKIPTAKFTIVSNAKDCLREASQFTPPYVLKADGLCGGKGVSICKSAKELEEQAHLFFDKKIFGEAGARAVLEQSQPGWELSFLVLTNGTEFQSLPIAQDHKRLNDGDEGPNTGGMGTLAPLTIESSLRERIEMEIVLPSIESLKNKGIVFRGFIFFGIMVTPQGPSLLEYNCRLGDPETQVILPLIHGDFGLLMRDLAMGKVSPIQIRPVHTACVVMAAPGYPMIPEKGVPIEGDLMGSTESSYFLVAGASRNPQMQWITSGGRVLNSIGLGSTKQEAIEKAYTQAKRAKWIGLIMRTDIGSKSPQGPT